jgi:alpha-galactosidase
MEINFHTDLLDIKGEWIYLGDIVPEINGMRISNYSVRKLIQGESAFALEYSAPILEGGTFLLEVVPDGQERCRLRFHVKNFPSTLDSYGIHIKFLENVRSYFLSGNSSRDNSYYVEPENFPDGNYDWSGFEEGFAVTQLLPRIGIGSLVIGFIRHDRFLQKINFKYVMGNLSLSFQTIWCGKSVRLGGLCTSEWLVIFDHFDIEEALCDWARIVAEESPITPRNNHLTGLGWYSLSKITENNSEEDILRLLEDVVALSRTLKLPLGVFQIGGGFTPASGDWLETISLFPRGIKHILDEIRRAGFIPGLEIAPLLVGKQSHLFLEHPDWVVRDETTGNPMFYREMDKKNGGDNLSEELFILDITHPDAFEYLRRVFHIWRHEWGCEFFKTDSLLIEAAFESGTTRYYQSGKTKLEVWRDTATMIRSEIGDAYWLGCNCPIWASIGLVDGVCIGEDIGISSAGEFIAESFIRDLEVKNFSRQILWKIFPASFSCGKKILYPDDYEFEALVILAGMSGGVMFSDEVLNELLSESHNLLKLIASPSFETARFPLLGRSPITYYQDEGQYTKKKEIKFSLLDPVIVQVKDGKEPGTHSAVYIFNNGKKYVQRSYPVESLGFMGPLYIHEWRSQILSTQPEWLINVHLEPHQGKLFFLNRQPFDELPMCLP